MDKKEYIYRVAFHYAPLDNDKKDYYFHSVAAIYDLFTPGQVGCAVQNLWNIGVANGNAYESKSCRITREEIRRKKRAKA